MRKSQTQRELVKLELIELDKALARLEQTLQDRTAIQAMLQYYKDKKLVDA